VDDFPYSLHLVFVGQGHGIETFNNSFVWKHSKNAPVGIANIVHKDDLVVIQRVVVFHSPRIILILRFFLDPSLYSMGKVVLHRIFGVPFLEQFRQKERIKDKNFMVFRHALRQLPFMFCHSFIDVLRCLVCKEAKVRDDFIANPCLGKKSA
jgi:hypothetical protein